jgi:hypothetical protein
VERRRRHKRREERQNVITRGVQKRFDFEEREREREERRVEGKQGIMTYLEPFILLKEGCEHIVLLPTLYQRGCGVHGRPVLLRQDRGSVHARHR